LHTLIAAIETWPQCIPGVVVQAWSIALRSKKQQMAGRRKWLATKRQQNGFIPLRKRRFLI
jgi:hypothetical protein